MTRSRFDPLTFAATIFVFGIALHTLDHFRRGSGLPLFGVTPEVLAGGIAISIGGGFFTAVEVSASHLAPPWGVFNQSYLVLRPDTLAWVIVLIEIPGRLFAGLAGLEAMRRTRTHHGASA